MALTLRENVKAILETNFSGYKEEFIAIAEARICEVIKEWKPEKCWGCNCPKIRLEEETHSEWIIKGEIYQCENCEKEWHEAFLPYTWTYCPNCGSKKRKG